jgi:hypothetical protein
MQVQLNTNNHVSGSQNLSTWVDAEVRAALKRFDARVKRVEVHLHDLDADKSHGNDKRCVVEARVAGRSPLSVTNDASNMDRAIRGALEKAAHALDHAFGKQEASLHSAAKPTLDDEV